MGPKKGVKLCTLHSPHHARDQGENQVLGFLVSGGRAHDGRSTTDAPQRALGHRRRESLDRGRRLAAALHDHRTLERRVSRPSRLPTRRPLRRRRTRRPGRHARLRCERRRGAARGVELRHSAGQQNGSPYLTDWFQSQSRFHGFTPSFAFVGEPETNGVVERFNRTLKEQIIHGRTYRDRDELAAAVAVFVATYNREWRLEKLRYQSPLEARRAYQSSKPLSA